MTAFCITCVSEERRLVNSPVLKEVHIYNIVYQNCIIIKLGTYVIANSTVTLYDGQLHNYIVITITVLNE